MPVSTSKTHSPLRGYLYAVVASSLYALISVLGKLVLHEGTDPMTLIFYQYAIASGAMYIGIRSFCPQLLRVNRLQVRQMGIQGIIGALGTNICFFFALKYLNAGITSMLLFTNPMFVTLFFALTGIKILRSVNYIALAMAMMGSALVLDIFRSGMTSMPLPGILLGLGSALTYAFYNVYADMRMMDMSPYTITFYTNLYGCAVSGALLVVTQGGFPAISFMSLIYILLIALVAGIMPVVFFYKSVALIGSERTSIVATLELPFTLIVAFAVLGEKLNWMQGVGVFLVLGAAVFLHLGDKKNPANTEKDSHKEILHGQ